MRLLGALVWFSSCFYRPVIVRLAGLGLFIVIPASTCVALFTVRGLVLLLRWRGITRLCVGGGFHPNGGPEGGLETGTGGLRL